MTVSRHGDLQLDQDLDFQRREWRAQRIGRIALTAIIVAALAGVFGGGPVAHARAGTSDGRLSVRYERIARHGAPAPIRVHVVPAAAGDSAVAIWLDADYAQGLVMRGISPEPVESRLGDGRIIYRFQVADPSRAVDIVFQVDASRLWSRRGAVGLVAGDSIHFSQFVLP